MQEVRPQHLKTGVLTRGRAFSFCVSVAGDENLSIFLTTAVRRFSLREFFRVFYAWCCGTLVQDARRHVEVLIGMVALQSTDGSYSLN